MGDFFATDRPFLLSESDRGCFVSQSASSGRDLAGRGRGEIEHGPDEGIAINPRKLVAGNSKARRIFRAVQGTQQF